MKTSKKIWISFPFSVEENSNKFQAMVDEEPKYFKYFICLCYFSHRVSKVLTNQQKIGIMLRTISDKQNSRTFSRTNYNVQV